MKKTCTFCGQEYDGRSDSRFCSTRCKNAFHRNANAISINGDENVSGNDDETDSDFPQFKPKPQPNIGTSDFGKFNELGYTTSNQLSELGRNVVSLTSSVKSIHQKLNGLLENDEVQDRLTNIENQISDLENSDDLRDKITDLKEELADAQKKASELAKDNEELQDNYDSVKSELDELKEDYDSESETEEEDYEPEDETEEDDLNNSYENEDSENLPSNQFETDKEESGSGLGLWLGIGIIALLLVNRKKSE